MQPSPEISPEPNHPPPQPAGRDWGKIGLWAAFFSLIGIVFGVVALVVTGGFAVFFGPLLFVPMVFIPLIVSPIGFVLGLLGARSPTSSKPVAAGAIALNGLIVAGLLTFGGPLFGGLMLPWVPRAPNNYLYSLRFSPNGQTLATGWTNDIHLLDVATGKLVQRLEGHTGEVDFVAYSSDGTKLASASRGESVILWDVATGQALHTFAWEGAVQALAFQPDGQILMVATRNKGITLLDTTTYAEIETIAQTGRPMLFSTDGAYVGLGDPIGLTIANTTDYRHPIVIRAETLDQFAFSNDIQIAALSLQDLNQEQPGELQIWALPGQELLYSSALSYSASEALNGYSVTLAVSPDGKQVAYTAGQFFDLYQLDLQQTVSFTASSEFSRFPVSTILFSPDGARVTANVTDAALLWDVATQQLLWTYTP